VTKDNKAVVAAEAPTTVEDFTWLTAKFDEYDKDLKEASVGRIVGNGGWAQWAQLGTGRSLLRFYWRGKSVDYQTPIYNRPTGMEAAPKSGQPLGPNSAVILNGYDLVYRGGEGLDAFLNKVTIKVTYSKQGGAANDTATRDNLVGDIANGTCRGTYTYTDDQGDDYTVPTLYSDTIFNWIDASELLLATKFLNAPDSLASRDAALSASALNKTNSANYVNRERTVRGRIYYRGWAGNYEASRVVNSGNQIQVAPTGYPKDPIDEYPDYVAD